MARITLVLLGVVWLVTACSSSGVQQRPPGTRAVPGTSARTPTSGSAHASASTPGGASPPHVMVIVEENHSFDEVIGNPDMPFFNSLARSYALATAYTGVSHPSEPNYLAMMSGSVWNNPQDLTPQDGTYPGQTFVDQLAGKGISWKAYMEDMPSACDRTDSYGPGAYDVNHNPFMYFDSIRTSPQQCNRDVPFTQFTPDLQGGNAPAFMFVVPNTAHDMHDGTPAQADAWLAARFKTIFASAWYRQGGVVVVTFDEGETSDRVATVVVSASTRNTGRFTPRADHYGLLRGLEETYGVPLLRAAGEGSHGDLAPLLKP